MTFVAEPMAAANKFQSYTSLSVLLLTFFSSVALLLYLMQDDDGNIVRYLYYQRLKQKQNLMPKVTRLNQSYLIFQIGFNKAGTSALSEFFSANGIEACHYDAFHLPLSENMFDQQMSNKSVLQPFLRNNSMYFQYYGDFGVFIQQSQIEDILFLNSSYQEGQSRTWYELLERQYPEYEKLFILNIRNVNNWIKSRYRWHTDHCGDAQWLSECAAMAVNQTFNGQIDEIEVLYRWKRLWYQYICNLLSYFQSHGHMNKLVVFDIEHDSPQKLVDFFGRYGFDLNASFYGLTHDHKSVKFAKNHPNEDEQRLSQWKRIEETYPDLAADYDEYDNEHQRIAMKCKR